MGLRAFFYWIKMAGKQFTGFLNSEELKTEVHRS